MEKENDFNKVHSTSSKYATAADILSLSCLLHAVALQILKQIENDFLLTPCLP